jgi:hypothetical protein
MDVNVEVDELWEVELR